MTLTRPAMVFRRVQEYDLVVCEFFNRACRRRRVEQFFAAVSRLGDGVFWYTLILVLPLLYGMEAFPVTLTMGLVAALGVLTYKLLKSGTTRPRPHTVTEIIHLGTAPLDQFSFPSGHTLHAVSFSIIAVSQYPELGWVLVPFSSLVAASRVVLGLHYPTDVLAGAALGAALALLGLALL